MPFKTKRKKKEAQSRRITISSQGLATYESEKDVSEGLQSSKVKEKSNDIYLKQREYVGGEMVKITLLGLLIIGIQIVLFLGKVF